MAVIIAIPITMELITASFLSFIALLFAFIVNEQLRHKYLYLLGLRVMYNPMQNMMNAMKYAIIDTIGRTTLPTNSNTGTPNNNNTNAA